jgi:hypothetical protein
VNENVERAVHGLEYELKVLMIVLEKAEVDAEVDNIKAGPRS